MEQALFKCVLFLIAIFFMGACTKNHIGTIKEQSVSLYKCSDKSIEPYICFDSLLQDSRCPIGEECVWSGTAIVKISFHENGRSHELKMSLKEFPGLGYPADTIIQGYKISFIDLKPHPSFDNPVPQSSEILASFNIMH